MEDERNVVKDYWKKRYEKKFTIGSSGHVSFNEGYNSFVYRAYERALKKALSHYGGAAGKHVFDVGSGTGYWIEYYRKAEAAGITGVDLVDLSISNLRVLYPQYDLEVADIGSSSFAAKGRFDIVNCLDVLYYITADDAFGRALSNLADSLNQNGVLFITDTFRDAGPPRPPYYYQHRNLETYRNAMDKVGLVPEIIIPVNYLLKKPIPLPSVYSFVKWQLTKLHVDLERIIGGLIYRVDPLFMSRARSDILLMTARKRPNSAAGDRR